jgi:hypothetical protein
MLNSNINLNAKIILEQLSINKLSDMHYVKFYHSTENNIKNDFSSNLSSNEKFIKFFLLLCFYKNKLIIMRT